MAPFGRRPRGWKAPVPLNKLDWDEGKKLEDRLFGGIHDASHLTLGARNTPLAKIIRNDREVYNRLRVRFGLAEIGNWRVRPKFGQMIQGQDTPGAAGESSGLPGAARDIPGRWVTINGRHTFIRRGERMRDVLDRLEKGISAEKRRENKRLNMEFTILALAVDGMILPSVSQSILLEDLATDELEFAKDTGCVWRVINGRRVCIKPKGTTEERIARAIASHKPSDLKAQRAGAEGANMVSKILGSPITVFHKGKGGKLVPHPLDIEPFMAGGKLHAVEVKTLHHNTNNKLTFHPPAMRRKLKYATRIKADVTHTVAVDLRDRNPKYAAYYSGVRVWHREGFGSYQLSTMTPVGGGSALLDVIKKGSK